MSELTDAEIAQLPRDAADMELYGRKDIADLYRRVIAEREALRKELSDAKAEIDRLEHGIRHAGVMLAECAEYIQQGLCKDAIG